MPSPNAPALTGEIQDGDEAYAAPEQSDPNLPAVSKATETTAEADPVERLRALIADRQEETVEILRSWLDEPREHT